jgi:hypothetical protein
MRCLLAVLAVLMMPSSAEALIVTLGSHPSDRTASTSASFSFTATGNPSSTDCSLDGAAPAACSSPVSYPDMAPGAHSFEVTAATDTLSASHSVAWVIDITPPETTIVSAPPDSSSTSATIDLASDDPGATFTCALDTASFSACADPTTLTGLSAGSHTFQARATDDVGNTDPTSAVVTWTVTAPPPVPNPSWRGDFSTGDWSQYDDCRSHHMDGVYATYYTVSRASAASPFGAFSCSGSGARPNQETGPTPSGFAYAGKFTVDSSSTTGAAGQRTLDTLWPQDSPSTGKTKAYQGATTWYRDDQYFPADFRPVADSDWNWTYEVHNWPDNFGDADLSCGVDTTTSVLPGPFTDGGGNGERLSCRVLGGGSPTNPIDARTSTGARKYGSGNWYTNPDVRWTDPIGVRQIQRGHWYDLTFKIKWSWQQDARSGCTDPSSATGCFEWWVDGTKVASWSGPTLLYYADNNTDLSGSTAGAGQGYLDHGYYRSTSATWRASVYHGATMIGPTAASVGQ